MKDFDTVMDYGAGDCAASHVLSRETAVSGIHVVDPSMRARTTAELNQLGYSEDLTGAPRVDLVYAAHSIEHVHDLRLSLAALLQKVRTGGHIFFETPNIANWEIFKALPHTPHTFMLSSHSFHFLEMHFPMEIVAIETCGPPWNKSRKHIRSDEKADLRVLLKKNGFA